MGGWRLRHQPAAVKTLDTRDKGGEDHESVNLGAFLELRGGPVDPGMTCGLRGVHRPSAAGGTPADIWFKFNDDENPCHPQGCGSLGEMVCKRLHRTQL